MKRYITIRNDGWLVCSICIVTTPHYFFILVVSIVCYNFTEHGLPSWTEASHSGLTFIYVYLFSLPKHINRCGHFVLTFFYTKSIPNTVIHSHAHNHTAFLYKLESAEFKVYSQPSLLGTVQPKLTFNLNFGIANLFSFLFMELKRDTCCGFSFTCNYNV